ncbi:hypothetical protein EVG20_g6935 [Dentipellis fragilis]|uniref:Uncharacterized protein n=1 Tax=Dentipellis fragilis TaxID=205917 RepID=A0A4Y9YJ85_9AGAM|nr:hypothetical protein EVG20_g6935 [Dentipellis fragilis]
MHTHNQMTIPPHPQDDVLFEPRPYEFSSQSMAALASGKYQSQLSGEPRGAYDFVNVHPYSRFPLNEPLSLANRPPEDIHLGAPQAPPIAASRGPDVYAQRSMQARTDIVMLHMSGNPPFEDRLQLPLFLMVTLEDGW